MFCSSCGAQLDDTARFCRWCGAARVVMAPTRPVPVNAPAPVYEPVPVAAPVVVPEPAPAVPVAEEATVPPVVEEIPVTAPIAEPVPVAPVVEEAPAAPVFEPAPAAPVVEEAPVAPVFEPAPAAPVVEEAPVAPVFEPAPAAPVVEEAPVAPVFEPAPAAPPAATVVIPVVEPAPAAPVDVFHAFAAPQATAPYPQPGYVQPNAPVYQQPAPAPVKKKTGPNLGIRILLGICTAVLCILLSASLVATVLVADLQRLVSEDGLEAVASDLLSEQPQDTALFRFTAAVDADASAALSDSMSTSALSGLIYDALEAEYGDKLKASPEDVEEFLEESTVKDVLAEKVISYAMDLINGTDETEITEKEIVQIIEDNERLVEEIFDVEINSSTLRSKVHDFMEKNDINELLRTQVLEPICNAKIPGLTSMLSSLNGISGEVATVEDLMAQIRVMTSGEYLIALIIFDVLLILLILLTRRMKVGSFLISVGTTFLAVGIIVSLPVALFQLLPGMIGDSLAVVDLLASLLSALIGCIAPIHYGLLLAGLLLMIPGYIIRGVLRKRAVAAVS